MTITWHGLGCFRLQADGATLITDPLFSMPDKTTRSKIATKS